MTDIITRYLRSDIDGKEYKFEMHKCDYCGEEHEKGGDPCPKAHRAWALFYVREFNVLRVAAFDMERVTQPYDANETTWARYAIDIEGMSAKNTNDAMRLAGFCLGLVGQGTRIRFYAQCFDQRTSKIVVADMTMNLPADAPF